MGRWVTRNGAHIYIPDEDEIVEQENKKERQISANKSEGDKLNNKTETFRTTEDGKRILEESDGKVQYKSKRGTLYRVSNLSGTLDVQKYSGKVLMRADGGDRLIGGEWKVAKAPKEILDKFTTEAIEKYKKGR